MKARIRHRILTALALLAAGATGVFAQTTLNWTNTAGGFFAAPGNWNPNQVPGTNAVVVFNNQAPGPYTVTLDDTASNHVFRVSTDAVIFDLAGHDYTCAANDLSNLEVGTGLIAPGRLSITNSGASTNRMLFSGFAMIGQDTGSAIQEWTGTVSIAGANVEVDRLFYSANRNSYIGKKASLSVSEGARFHAGTFATHCRGVLTVRDPGSRLDCKWVTFYAGSAALITNGAAMRKDGGGIMTVHEGARVTFADNARYARDDGSYLSAGRSDAMNGRWEILDGSFCHIAMRFQIATVAVANEATVVVDGTGSTLKASKVASQGFHGVFIGVTHAGSPGGKGRVTVSNGGLIDTYVYLYPTGILQGDGTIDAGVAAAYGGVQNGGTIIPGWPVTGTLNVTGSFFNTIDRADWVAHAGTLEFHLNGTGDGEHGRLAVNGPVTLGGTCRVRLINGHKPRYGDRFHLLSWTSLAGEFASLDLPGASGDWDVSELYTSGEIVYVRPNGTVLSVR